jgi:hypothetical protein
MSFSWSTCAHYPWDSNPIRPSILDRHNLEKSNQKFKFPAPTTTTTTKNRNKKPEYKVVGVPENEAGLRKTGLELLQAVGGGGRGRDCWYGGWRHIESLDGP